MKKNITRDDIAEAINIEFGLSKKDCLDIVNDIIDSIILGLEKYQIFKIHNFGTFKIKKQKAKIGRNPKNGLKVEIPEKKTIQWKMSKELFNKLNKKNE